MLHDYLARFDNLQVAGRGGMFRYQTWTTPWPRVAGRRLRVVLRAAAAPDEPWVAAAERSREVRAHHPGGAAGRIRFPRETKGSQINYWQPLGILYVAAWYCAGHEVRFL